mgnify:CR=1 FL=1
MLKGNLPAPAPAPVNNGFNNFGGGVFGNQNNYGGFGMGGFNQNNYGGFNNN